MLHNVKRWGHDFTRNREGECLTLIYLGKIHVSKGNTQKMYAHFLLMHSRFHLPSRCGERRDVWIIHPSQFQFNFTCCACIVHHRDFTQNIVVDSDLSLFHPVHEHCVFVLFAEPYLVLCCSHVVTILSMVVQWSPLS